MSLRSPQSRSGSLIEAVTNVVAGFVVAMLAQQVAFPLFGIVTSIGEDVGIAALFTVVSLARSYAIRRLFEHLALHGLPSPASR